MYEANYAKHVIDFLLDSNHEQHLSLLETSEPSSPFLSSFTLKDDLTYYSPIIKINFDPSSFEQHLLAEIYNLELVDSTNYEEPLHDNENKDINLGNEFEPFISEDLKHITFDNDLNTSSYLECLIATTSNEIYRILDDILT